MVTLRQIFFFVMANSCINSAEDFFFFYNFCKLKNQGKNLKKTLPKNSIRDLYFLCIHIHTQTHQLLYFRNGFTKIMLYNCLDSSRRRRRRRKYSFTRTQTLRTLTSNIRVEKEVFFFKSNITRINKLIERFYHYI